MTAPSSHRPALTVSYFDGAAGLNKIIRDLGEGPRALAPGEEVRIRLAGDWFPADILRVMASAPADVWIAHRAPMDLQVARLAPAPGSPPGKAEGPPRVQAAPRGPDEPAEPDELRGS